MIANESLSEVEQVILRDDCDPRTPAGLYLFAARCRHLCSALGFHNRDQLEHGDDLTRRLSAAARAADKSSPHFAAIVDAQRDVARRIADRRRRESA